jgi:hypothetical protein
VKLPSVPNLNAHAETFVRAIKGSCLDRMILLGEGAPRTATLQFVSHYLKERNHQGLANRIINPEPCGSRKTGAVERRQRLGGLLNYYCRAADSVKRPDIGAGMLPARCQTVCGCRDNLPQPDGPPTNDRTFLVIGQCLRGTLRRHHRLSTCFHLRPLATNDGSSHWTLRGRSTGRKRVTGLRCSVRGQDLDESVRYAASNRSRRNALIRHIRSLNFSG